MSDDISARRDYYLAKIKDAEAFLAEAPDVQTVQIWTRVLDGYRALLKNLLENEPATKPPSDI